MTQAADAARKQANGAIIDELARGLASASKLIPTLYPESPDFTMPPPSDEEAYRKMATDLVENKKTTITDAKGNTIEISMDSDDPNSIDARDTKNGGLFKKALGVDNLNKLASQKGVDAFSDAIGDAVEKNTSNIGFLGGATIMNALKGLIQWLISGFEGGFDGLKQNIAQVTANSIHRDTTANLQKLRSDQPEMANMLTNDTIKKAADGAYFGALEQAGFPSPNTPEKTKFSDITPIEVGGEQRMAMRNGIYNEMMNPETGDDLGTTIGNALVEKKREGFLSNRFGWVKGVTENRLREDGQKMGEVIATTVSQRATDPDNAQELSQMSREEYANYMANEVSNELALREERMGLSIKLTEERMGDIIAGVRDGIDKNYDKLSSVTRMVATGSEKQNNLAEDPEVHAAAQGAKDAGLGGMIEPEEVVAQAGGKIGQSLNI